jgi:hypothetical protein
MTLSSSLWACRRLVVVEKRNGGRIRKFKRFGGGLYVGGKGMQRIFNLTMRAMWEAATTCSSFAHIIGRALHYENTIRSQVI